MKKIFTLFCVALLANVLFANVVTGTCGDNLNWEYDTDTKALVITGYGDMYDYVGSEYWNSNTPWSQVGDEITSVSFNEGITKIGSSAFVGCYNIESIVIPNSVSRIENYAFQHCVNLSSVTLGSGLKYVGYNAFYNCYNVSTTNYTGDVASWCNIQFSSRESNPISISQNLYINNQELIDLVIPAGVNIISSHAFYNCATIKSITIPKSVKIIGTWALDGIWFDSVNYLGEIGDWCDIEFLGSSCNPMGSTRNFYFNNNKVKNIVIPNTVDTIHQGAFYNACFNSITIPNSVKLIGDYAFSSCSQIIIEATTPPLISNTSLIGVKSILVPCAAMDNYLAADIWQFLNINGVNNFKIDLSTTDYGQAACVTHTECETNVITIEAFPFYNSIFAQWSDGNTDNPRTLTLTQDLSLEAQFEEIPYYTVRLSGSSLYGRVDDWYFYDGETYVEFEAPKGTEVYFREEGGCGEWLGWSDGSYDRERTIVVTSDTTITSRFDVQTYSVSITAGEGGYLENGDIVREYNDCNRDWIYTCAYANEGYYFKGWSNGNTYNCIDLYPYEDIQLVAEFAPKSQVQVLLGVDNASKGMGTVSGSGIFYSGDWVTITATPKDGYHFVEWSDGSGLASREIYLQQDTTLFATFAAGEYGGKCGENLYWTFNNGHLSITGTGDMDLDNYPAWNNYYEDWYDNVTAVQFPEGITSIDDYAFSGMSLTSVVVPSSVTYFGENAFSNNYNLTRFEYQGTEAECEGDEWGNGNILQSCYNLHYFKGQVNMLSYDNDYLDTVIITSGEMFDRYYYYTTYIDNSNANNTYFGEGYLRDDVLAVETLLLPNGLLEIGDFALHNARHLEQITIPAGVTRIGESAFEECRSLESVTFAGKALREIDDWAFYNCHSLKTINIPEGVTEIGKAAFFDCAYLKEITLPSTTQTIADNAFGQCQKVSKMTVNAAVPPMVEAETFEDIDRGIPLYVPLGTSLKYRESDYWCEFFNVIEYDVPAAIENTTSPLPASNIQKTIRNGQLIILRDGVEYNTLGQAL